MFRIIQPYLSVCLILFQLTAFLPTMAVREKMSSAVAATPLSSVLPAWANSASIDLMVDPLPTWFALDDGTFVHSRSLDPETYTDDAERYRFEGLPHGTHKVTVDPSTLPAHLHPFEGEASPVLWLTPGMEGTSEALSSGVRFTAFYDPNGGTITGVVFWDTDGDGLQDPGEPGLPGIRVVDPTLHQYFVSFDDIDLWTLFEGKASCHGPAYRAYPPLVSNVFLTASSDGTVYYYDHWEDGYDPDPLYPGPTTEAGILDAGATRIFASDILTASVGAGPPYYYDGRDRISVFGEDAQVVRLVNADSFSMDGNCPGFPGSSGWLAAAWEIPEAADWGTEYLAAVGEDLAFSMDHDYSGLEVMAWQPGTDVYYNGTWVGTLDAGGVFFVEGADDGAGGGGVDSTDTVTATAPIQVQMMTGACAPGQIVSAHGYTLQPVDVWDSAYWAPVPGFLQTCNPDGANVDTDIYLHDPHSDAITVTVSSGASADVVIPANSTSSVLDATGWPDLATGNQGTYLFSSETFWGIVAVDSATNGATAAEAYDWGYSLIPESRLSSQVVIGYAPGRPTAPFDNGNLAFVTVVTDTWIYVDLNQDGLPDPFDMDGDGLLNTSDAWGVAEWDEPLSALGVLVRSGQVLRVGDPNDYDLMGALIYTTDLEKHIAVAWGQDACGATRNEYLDLGYTILPVPIPSLSKTDDLAIDADLSGGFSPGDTVTYTLVLHNNGQGSEQRDAD